MFDPITWMLIQATAILGGATASAIGTVNSFQQARENAKMQQAQLDYNKRLEEREASEIEAETAENARRQRLQAEKVKAQQRALLGKSGAAMDAGSPLAILGQTALDEELGVQDSMYKGYKQSMQHREQAKMYGYQAGVARSQAPSGSSLGLSLTGQAFNTIGSLAEVGSNYNTQQAMLKYYEGKGIK